MPANANAALNATKTGMSTPGAAGTAKWI